MSKLAEGERGTLRVRTARMQLPGQPKALAASPVLFTQSPLQKHRKVHLPSCGRVRDDMAFTM